MGSVTLSNIVKDYGSFRAIHGIDAEVRDGEFLILVGPSGCGKSTLLRMIAGLEEITSGEMRIGDRVINDVEPNGRDIAMVFQNYALYPHKKVKDNMAYGLKLKRVPKAEIDEKVAHAASILDLGLLLDRYPRELSGGQKQRVAMGRAIVRDPAVFLFDEPLSNLDAKLRVQMRAEIKALHQRLDTTMVYVTHDQVEAMTMADRIIVMRSGRIEQIGTPLELYENPANDFVATFIGSPSMNLIPGTVTGDNIRTDDGVAWPLPTGHSTSEGQKVKLGIRPQDIELQDTGIAAKVIITEPTGAETHLQLEIGNQAITASLRGKVDVGPDEVVKIAPLPDASYLFDGETGVAI